MHISRCRTKSSPTVTFFQGPDHFHLAVSYLELIKEGAHFELVDGSSPQLTDHHPVLPRGAHLHDAPLPLWLAVLGRRPVEHLVTLDVRGLLLDLVEARGGGKKHAVCFISCGRAVVIIVLTHVKSEVGSNCACARELKRQRTEQFIYQSVSCQL